MALMKDVGRIDLAWDENVDWGHYLRDYLRLQSQHDHLSRASSLDSTPTASPTTPTHRGHSPLAGQSPASIRFPSPGHQRLEEAGDTDQILDITHQIKCELVSLLNSHHGRYEPSFRLWVQDRLLDTEHELKRLRRRRSTSSRDVAELIGARFRLNNVC